MKRKKLVVGVIIAVVVVIAVVTAVVLLVVVPKSVERSEQYLHICNRPMNIDRPFCDSTLTFNERVKDLVSRLTLQEKMNLLGNRAAGASENVQLDSYNWSHEALHGLVFNYEYVGTIFRPPTEHATVFPQIISLSAAFDRDLFYQMANAIGNEARQAKKTQNEIQNENNLLISCLEHFTTQAIAV